MQKLILSIGLILFCLISCEKNEIDHYLNNLEENRYYSNEIFSGNQNELYGSWLLTDISGGFSGTGYEPNFDILEVKKIGIYGIVRNDSLVEYGKIEIDTFDTRNPALWQVRFHPDFKKDLNSLLIPPERYVELKRDTLILNSPCCDMYNHHFKKIK